MTATQLFYLFISILTLDFIIEAALSYLNAKHFSLPIPELLQNVYEEEDYKKSQAYKRTNYKFGKVSSLFTLITTLAFFFLDGFRFVDDLVREITDNTILISLLFFGIILLGSSIISVPFSYYHTFVIEEKFGFNKSSKSLFVIDLIKGALVSCALGGSLLALIIWFYNNVGAQFWIYAWGLIAVFTILMNLFYAKLILPLFNKQTLLEEGNLKEKIAKYAQKVGFELDKIYVIDDSKRSTKANAFFSGFGKQKRITLYDTLINDLNEDEIVAVLAHEVGHYKKKHIITNLILMLATTGISLWLMAQLIDSQLLAEALGVNQPSFHIGMIAFGLLYTPISEVTGLLMNVFSRKFEYQADDYAKKTHNAKDLISALKKLSRNNLSNLTPHPWYVWYHFSHPTLLQRVCNLSK